MNFCDNDTPWGDVDTVVDVLEFLLYAASLPMPAMQPAIPQNGWNGLHCILLACSNTLKQARQSAQP